VFEKLPRENLAFLPTPVHQMPHLGDALGLTNLWIKRDDMTGISAGGNKTRKLEYVIGDAIDQGADTLVTVGSVQSNHCRQTAAAAAKVGLRCILLLGGEEPAVANGNLLLDKLFGAEIKYFPGEGFTELNSRMDSILETLQEFGLSPYAIPAGAAMPQGSFGYANAILELKEQMETWRFSPERIILPAGTGGTLAGMSLGVELADLDIEIVGITVLEEAHELEAKVNDLISRTLDSYPNYFTQPRTKITINDTFLEDGYGVFTSGCMSAIEMFAKMEGILLDPIYTAKAGLGLMRMALAGEIEPDSTTLFCQRRALTR
jgi:L-cysteate sulfo-lyase